MKVKIEGRLAFPSLFTARAFGDSEPAFSATFLLEPKSKSAAVINDAIEKVVMDKWADKGPALLKAMRAKGDVCLHDGAEKAQYDGFEGMLFVSARSKARPLVIDRDKTPLAEEDGRPYGGCYVVALLDIWAQDNQYGKRVNASLSGVQFLREGAAFGGGVPASPDEFDDLGVEEDLA